MSEATVFFHGSIPEAIGLAQRSHKLFLVYIANDGEESRKLEETTWTDSQVLDKVRQNAIAVRLVHGSHDASHFSALYPCSGVPCITIIGYEGVNILHRVGYVSGEELAGLVQQAMSEFNLQAARTMAAILGMQMANLASNDVVETASSGMQQAHDAGEASTSAARETAKQESDSSTAVEPMVASGGEEHEGGIQQEAMVLSTSDDGVSEATTSAPTSLDLHTPTRTSPSPSGEVVKQPGEVAETVQASAQAISEDESSDYEATKRTEKEDDAGQASSPVASEAQVEEKVNLEKKENQPSRKQRVEAQKPEPKPLKIPEKVSLQVKLTDGTAIRGEFNKYDDLWTVKSYVDTNRTDGGGNYSFAVPFPRKVFAAEDYETPLIDLGLGYRAALILVPTKDNKPIGQRPTPPGPSSPSGGGSSVGRWLSFLNPLSYMRGSGGPKSPPSSPPAAASSSESGDAKSDKLTRRKSWGANIHTLKHDEEDMFKRGNAYWNGNSTEFGSNDDKDK